MSTTPPAKKPFWKKPMGIILIALGIIVILGMSGILDNKDEPAQSSETLTTVNEETKALKDNSDNSDNIINVNATQSAGGDEMKQIIVNLPYEELSQADTDASDKGLEICSAAEQLWDGQVIDIQTEEGKVAITSRPDQSCRVYE